MKNVSRKFFSVIKYTIFCFLRQVNLSNILPLLVGRNSHFDTYWSNLEIQVHFPRELVRISTEYQEKKGITSPILVTP